jgi:FixJ family two-component response regulator
MNPGEPTLFLIDGDSVLRQSAASIAHSLHKSFAAFASAEEFLEKFDPVQHGCLIVEIRLPEMSGLELLEKLRDGGEIFTAIVVSADAEPATVVRAMRAGAYDFLKKPCDEPQLLEMLHRAFDRDAAHRRRLAHFARIHARRKKLTEGEKEVLALVLDGRMNREIAESLKLSVRAVEVRRSKIMAKMKASTQAELIRLAVLDEVHSAKSEHGPK